jgi:hypothetical protein
VHEWTGEPSDLGRELAQLASSDEYIVEGTTFEVPTREDYRTVLARAGLPKGGVALEDSPDLVAAVQAHWHAAGHNACVFAEALSATRAETGWESYVLNATSQPDYLADRIAEICVERLPVPEVQVVSALMPHLDDGCALAQVLRGL